MVVEFTIALCVCVVSQSTELKSTDLSIAAFERLFELKKKFSYPKIFGTNGLDRIRNLNL
jgi:hypothetical protein